VLYALAHPAALLLLALAFVVGITLLGWVSSVVAHRSGMRQAAAEGRLVPDPRRHLEPFGVLAAAIAGIGWAKPVDLPARKGRAIATALTGPLLLLGLGVGLLVLWNGLYGPVGGADAGILPFAAVVAGPAEFLQSGGRLSSSAALFLVGCSFLYLGALSLVPLPPLPGGMLILALAPRTQGWQKAEYQLVERNFGIVALLVLLLIPLGRSVPMLPTLLDIVLTPLVRVICGG
jgi:hypothetical protein